MFPYRTFLACFVLGMLVTLGVTPFVIRLAVRLKALERPANRKIHLRP